MKHWFKYFFKTIALFSMVFLLLTGCERDGDFQSKQSRFQIEILNSGQVLSNGSLTDKLKGFIPKGTVDAESCREIYNSDYGFTIDTDHVKHVTDTETGLDSYSFPIARDSITSGNLENLLLQSNQEGGYDAYMVAYGFTEAEYLNASGNFLENTTTGYSPIDFDTGVFNTGELAKMGYVCIEVWEQVWVPANQGNLVGVFEQGSYDWVLSSYSCSWLYESSQNGSGGGGGYSTGGGGSTSGTTDGTSTSEPSDIMDVVGTPAVPYTKPFLKFVETLDPDLQSFINNLDNVAIKNHLQSFLEEDFYSEEAIIAAKITAELYRTNNLTNFFTPAYEQILIDNLPPNGGLLGILLKYQVHIQREVYTIMMTEYEDGHEFTNWEIFKIVLRAHREAVHYGLDAAGMSPGIGIVFDVVNAALYTVEMDWTNATLSIGAAVPVLGQWVTTAKWAKKVVVLANGKKVYLKVYNLASGIVRFSDRSQLRKVLEITDSSVHAHHIIPYSFGVVNDIPSMTNAQKLVQNAAKSNNVWHINDIYNGIAMPETLHLTGHQAYINRIQERMEIIYSGLSNPNAYDEAYNGLMGLCNEIKTLIQQYPTLTSGQLATMF